MQNPTISDAIDNNDLTSLTIKHIVCLTKRIGGTYFAKTEPTQNTLDYIKQGYDEIQQWLEIASLLGEKAIEDMKKTSNLLKKLST